MTSSLPLTFDFPFSFPSAEAKLEPNATSQPTFNTQLFPSPPGSTYSDPGLEFDLESFTHTSPDSSLLLDDSFNWDFTTIQSDANVFAAPNISAATTPSSTRLVSPKSSISSFADLVGPEPAQTLPTIPQFTAADTAEALSNHHLQRYLHYKALAAQAEADARATAALQSQNDFEAYLATCSMPQSYPFEETKSKSDGAMLGYQAQSVGIFAPEAPLFAFHPAQQASLAHAQAEAHLQAHDMAAARAQQQRAQTGYWVAATQNAFGITGPPQPTWAPETAAPAPTAKPSPLPSSAASSVSVPIIAPTPLTLSAPSSLVRAFEGEGEEEIEVEESEQDRASVESSEVIPNINGGGRGYIPGQTPDDPKKRHKCNVCGRAFARAFNLKSHAQTHDPVRSKPHQCPHSSCKRGFSRLHDLERHRQGIHNDGPLVAAKTAGVSPAIVRAQARMVKRDSSSQSPQ